MVLAVLVAGRGAGEGRETMPVATDWGGCVALEDRSKAEVCTHGSGNRNVNGRVARARRGSRNGLSQDALDMQAKPFDVIRKSTERWHSSFRSPRSSR